MAKISEIKTNIDTYIHSYLSMQCYLLKTNDSQEYGDDGAFPSV